MRFRDDGLLALAAGNVIVGNLSRLTPCALGSQRQPRHGDRIFSVGYRDLMTRIRTMTPADVPLGMRLKQHAGWNQTKADWQRFLTLSPQGCFVAECDGQDAGTAATFMFGRIAWIAMILVDPAMRGRGVGTDLMHHCLSHLEDAGATSIRLDATALGKPIYEKLGFISQFDLLRYEGVVGMTTQQQTHRLTFRPADEGDLQPLFDFDAAATATRRDALLAQLYREQSGSFELAFRGDAIAGYAAYRTGSSAVQLGPIIAAPDAGAAVLSHVLTRCHGQAVYIDVAADNSNACRILEQANLRVQRTFTRMCAKEQVCEKIDWLWSSSGPEKG